MPGELIIFPYKMGDIKVRLLDSDDSLDSSEVENPKKFKAHLTGLTHSQLATLRRQIISGSLGSGIRGKISKVVIDSSSKNSMPTDFLSKRFSLLSFGIDPRSGFLSSGTIDRSRRRSTVPEDTIFTFDVKSDTVTKIVTGKDLVFQSGETWGQSRNPLMINLDLQDSVITKVLKGERLKGYVVVSATGPTDTEGPGPTDTGGAKPIFSFVGVQRDPYTVIYNESKKATQLKIIDDDYLDDIIESCPVGVFEKSKILDIEDLGLPGSKFTSDRFVAGSGGKFRHELKLNRDLTKSCNNCMKCYDPSTGKLKILSYNENTPTVFIIDLEIPFFGQDALSAEELFFRNLDLLAKNLGKTVVITKFI